MLDSDISASEQRRQDTIKVLRGVLGDLGAHAAEVLLLDWLVADLSAPAVSFSDLTMRVVDPAPCNGNCEHVRDERSALRRLFHTLETALDFEWYLLRDEEIVERVLERLRLCETLEEHASSLTNTLQGLMSQLAALEAANAALQAEVSARTEQRDSARGEAASLRAQLDSLPITELVAEPEVSALPVAEPPVGEVAVSVAEPSAPIEAKEPVQTEPDAPVAAWREMSKAEREALACRLVSEGATYGTIRSTTGLQATRIAELKREFAARNAVQPAETPRIAIETPHIAADIPARPLTFAEEIAEMRATAKLLEPAWNLEPYRFVQAVVMIQSGSSAADMVRDLRLPAEIVGEVRSEALIHANRMQGMTPAQQREYRQELLIAITPPKAVKS